MSYKIAIGSSDEKWIDETFGLAKRFLLFEFIALFKFFMRLS